MKTCNHKENCFCTGDQLFNYDDEPSFNYQCYICPVCHDDHSVEKTNDCVKGLKEKFDGVLNKNLSLQSQIAELKSELEKEKDLVDTISLFEFDTPSEFLCEEIIELAQKRQRERK